MMEDQSAERRQLFENAIALAVRRRSWFPFKWATVLVLYRAASDQEVLRRVDNAIRLRGEPFIPTLPELIDLLFEVAISTFGPLLPFGGKYARVLKEVVLEFISELLIPQRLAYSIR